MGTSFSSADLGPGLLHAQPGEPRRSRGGVELLVVVQFDDLAGLEVAGRLLGELHHQHCAHGEVGSDQHGSGLAFGDLADLGEIGRAQAGGAHDHRHMMFQAREDVGPHGRRYGEIHHDVDPGFVQGSLEIGEVLARAQKSGSAARRSPCPPRRRVRGLSSARTASQVALPMRPRAPHTATLILASFTSVSPPGRRTRGLPSTLPAPRSRTATGRTLCPPPTVSRAGRARPPTQAPARA